MAKYIADVSFVAHLEIEAENAEEATAKAHAVAESHSVYSDDALEEILDKTYCAGGTNEDPPMRNRRVFELRNPDFEQDEISVRKVGEV